MSSNLFVVYEKKMEEEKKRAIHRQEVYFQSIAQIATWTLAPILMVAHTSTITTLATSSIGHYTFRIPFNGIYHIVQQGVQYTMIVFRDSIL